MKTEVQRWFKDGGDNKFRYDYDINDNSIVFDVGGYKGTWASTIYNKYGSNLYIFEPIKKYFDIISNKFNTIDKIKSMNFGLSNDDKIIEISILDDGSSTHINGENKEKINLVNIVNFIEQNKIEYIDLLKLNVEGEEYNLLNCLIDSGIINKIKNIQVQFHDFIPNCIEKRNKIRNKLQNSHTETYCYEFVWENWKLKNE